MEKPSHWGWTRKPKRRKRVPRVGKWLRDIQFTLLWVAQKHQAIRHNIYTENLVQNHACCGLASSLCEPIWTLSNRFSRPYILLVPSILSASYNLPDASSRGSLNYERKDLMNTPNLDSLSQHNVCLWGIWNMKESITRFHKKLMETLNLQ